MIKVENVYKKYPGNDYFSVEDLSFEVSRGEVFGLLGHNGAGKTTTIRMLTTLYNPDKGKIFINKIDSRYEKNKIKKKLGVVFENPLLYNNLSGEENILYFGLLLNMKKSLIFKRLEKLYDDLEVDFAKMVVNKYSKGMKQKIAIIRALIHDPEIILLDEPTGGLDIPTRKLIRKYIKKLKSKNKIIIMTSHIAEDIDLLCDKIIILNKGKTLEYDYIKNLKTRYNEEKFENLYIEVLKKKV